MMGKGKRKNQKTNKMAKQTQKNSQSPQKNELYVAPDGWTGPLKESPAYKMAIKDKEKRDSVAAEYKKKAEAKLESMKRPKK